MSSNKRIIPLSVPNMGGNEWTYVKECLDTGWVSSVGKFVSDFEQAVADYVGAEYGVATMNGTAALHISQVVAGVQPKDFVIIPNLTFVATANAVKYAHADPILIDADPDTWQMDLDLLEKFLETETESKGTDLVHRATGRRISALMPVHVQGNIGDVDRLLAIAEKYGLPVIEDAAESLGSSHNGRKAGSFGNMGCLSFNGNKIISTGGGGVVVTNDEPTAKRLKHLTTTAKVDPMQYLHDEVGYNYRLVNVLAAIGVAQMEQLPAFVERKGEIAKQYMDGLAGVGDVSFQTVLPEVQPNWWLFTIQTERQADLLTHLNDQGCISRPFWMPMNQLPMYEDALYINDQDNSAAIHRSCLAIPCSTGITDEEVSIVIEEIKSFFS